MKYTIEGLLQDKLVNLHLNSIDALIIRFFIDYWSNSDKVKKETIDGKEYKWVNYAKVIAELPALEIKTNDGIYRRMAKIVKAGLMEHKVVRNSDGVFAFYRFTDKINSLIFKNESCAKEKKQQSQSDINPHDTDINPIPYGNKSVTHTDENCQQKINLPKNINLPNNNNTSAPRNLPVKLPKPPGTCSDKQYNFQVLREKVMKSMGSKYGKYENYGREMKSAGAIVEMGDKKHGDIPLEDFLHGMISMFWWLKQHGEEYWQKQPFKPSRLSSDGIWSGVLAEFEQRRKESSPDLSEADDEFLDEVFPDRKKRKVAS